MSTISDLTRAWLISALGLTPPQIASEADLETALRAGNRTIPGAEIAYAENDAGPAVAAAISPAAAATITGALLTVPANTRPVGIDFGATFQVQATGGGTLLLMLFDVTAGGAGTEIKRSARGVVPAQLNNISGFFEVTGFKRLAPSVTDRILQLKTLIVRDPASGLTINCTQGGTGGGLIPSYIQAKQL